MAACKNVHLHKHTHMHLYMYLVYIYVSAPSLHLIHASCIFRLDVDRQFDILCRRRLSKDGGYFFFLQLIFYFLLYNQNVVLTGV